MYVIVSLCGSLVSNTLTQETKWRLEKFNVATEVMYEYEFPASEWRSLTGKQLMKSFTSQLRVSDLKVSKRVFKFEASFHYSFIN